METAPKLYTVVEASTYFQRPISTIQRWYRDGILPGYRTGGEIRFTDADFLAYLNNCRLKGKRALTAVPETAPRGRRQARAS